jgi:hypothetical protein
MGKRISDKKGSSMSKEQRSRPEEEAKNHLSQVLRSYGSSMHMEIPFQRRIRKKGLFPSRFDVFLTLWVPLKWQTYPESSAHRQSFGAIQLAAAQRPNSDIVYHTEPSVHLN